MPKATFAENKAEGIHPVASIIGCEIPLQLAPQDSKIVRSDDEHESNPTSYTHYQRHSHPHHSPIKQEPQSQCSQRNHSIQLYLTCPIQSLSSSAIISKDMEKVHLQPRQILLHHLNIAWAYSIPRRSIHPVLPALLLIVVSVPPCIWNSNNLPTVSNIP